MSGERVPLGEPLAWTDEDLDRMAEVSVQDVQEAQAFVKRHAGPDMGLWDAAPVTEDASTP